MDGVRPFKRKRAAEAIKRYRAWEGCEEDPCRTRGQSEGGDDMRDKVEKREDDDDDMRGEQPGRDGDKGS